MIQLQFLRQIILCLLAFTTVLPVYTPVYTVSSAKIPETPDYFAQYPQLEYVIVEVEPVIEPERETAPIAKPIVVKQTFKETNIIVTNYYQNDGSSGSTTASGLKTSDFQIHPTLGAYMYKGRIVSATSNTTRLKRPLYAGYRTFELYDEFILTIAGNDYPAVVLDVCGACYGRPGESLQRIDVFTTHSTIGKQQAILKEG